MADLCTIATKATNKAKRSNDPKDHAAAALANEKAARFSLAQGDPKAMKKHAQAAAFHHQQSDSSSSESNPLLAWAKDKG